MRTVSHPSLHTAAGKKQLSPLPSDRRPTMGDRDFLTWLHERLEHVHGEPYEIDYMGKLRSVIEATPWDRVTPNTSPIITRKEDNT
jgi:hypothetical protein